MRAIDLPREAVDAYVAGESELSIARRYGVSRRVVGRHLDRAGVQRRGRSAAGLVRASRLTPIERQLQAQAAHAAKRGKRESEEQRERVALAREKSGAGMSDIELQLYAHLWADNIEVVSQKAVGRYNIDLAIADDLAVEVLGGAWHTSKRHADRTAFLLERGWRVLFLWLDKRHAPTVSAVDAIRIAMRSKAKVMQACGHGYIGIHDGLMPTWPGKCD